MNKPLTSKFIFFNKHILEIKDVIALKTTVDKKELLRASKIIYNDDYDLIFNSYNQFIMQLKKDITLNFYKSDDYFEITIDNKKIIVISK